jgi:pyruvate/2-oxoglutarate dehydrogenase complex dihydrolipoamide acyltransferase (E2) component
MATNYNLPEIGESIEGVLVVNILIKSGDEIAVDQTIMEVEADKAQVDLPSTVAGKVVEVFVEPEQEVEIGSPLFSYE